jgi:hypothetical protein
MNSDYAGMAAQASPLTKSHDLASEVCIHHHNTEQHTLELSTNVTTLVGLISVRLAWGCQGFGGILLPQTLKCIRLQTLAGGLCNK